MQDHPSSWREPARFRNLRIHNVTSGQGQSSWTNYHTFHIQASKTAPKPSIPVEIVTSRPFTPHGGQDVETLNPAVPCIYSTYMNLRSDRFFFAGFLPIKLDYSENTITVAINYKPK
jgi:hypothetical protein